MMDPNVRRHLQDLQAGRIGPIGDVTLEAAPATSTTVTTRSCSSTSLVLLMHNSGRAANQTVQYITPGDGSFVITHTAHATPDLYRWVVFSPVNR